MWLARPAQAPVALPKSSPYRSDDLEQVNKKLAGLPVIFERNMGQVAEEVKFFGRSRGYHFFLTPTETVAAAKNAAPGPMQDVLRIEHLNSNRDPQIAGESEAECKTSYIKGEEKDWISNVPNYHQVRYKDLYPGIDTLYYGNGALVEYDYVVAPHADPAQIRMKMHGPKKLEVDSDGLLLARYSTRYLFMLHKPVAFQDVDGKRMNVAVDYVLEGQEVSLRLGEYDKSRTLVIDPQLSYGTYLGDPPDSVEAGAGAGGFTDDTANALAVGSGGVAFVTGATNTVMFPQVGAAGFPNTLNRLTDPTQSNATDAYYFRLNATGTALISSAFLGGSGTDVGSGIAVAGNGNIYVTGNSTSGNFPIKNSIRGAAINGDAFVIAIGANGSGNDVIYSFLLGGGGADNARAIVVDTANNAYVAGDTASTDFPVLNAFRSTSGGGQDAFLTKIAATATPLVSLVYSTYLGGAAADGANGVAVDGSGNAYITGTTSSNNFPVMGTLSPTLSGGSDAFVTKFNPTGSVLIYSYYLGGAANDGGQAVRADASGNAHVTGFCGAGFPLSSATQSTFGGGARDAFYSKVSATGTALLFSTFLGGAGDDTGRAIAVDSGGTAFITGSTASNNFPLSANAYQTTFGGNTDIFVAKYNPTGAPIVYSTYLGGGGADSGNGIGTSGTGEAFVCGTTDANTGNLATIGSLRGLGGQTTDIFVIKFDDTTPQITSAGILNLELNVNMTPYQITGTNSPTIFNASGLPAGLSINTGTGVISGAPVVAGTFDVVVFASNDNNQFGTRLVKIFINTSPPVITSATSVIGAVNQAFSYLVVATQNPTTFTLSGQIPPGLAFDNVSGTLSGIPSGAGTFITTMTAANNIGTATQTLTITINPPPPVITSADTATATRGASFLFRIAATNNPASFAAVGLPAAFSFNATTGEIFSSLVPLSTALGTTNVTLTATNGGGTSTAQTFRLVVDNRPVISSLNNHGGTINIAINTYTITVSDPSLVITAYGATGLPPGLSVNTGNGQITGIPTAAGTYVVTVSATNAGGLTGTQQVTFTIQPGPPSITSNLNQAVKAGTPFTYAITATNAPSSFGAAGLPSGLSVNSTTGIISGSPTQAGTFNVTISATNASGTGSATLVLLVDAAPPTITSALAVSGFTNTSFLYVITASGLGPITFTITGPLPDGVIQSGASVVGVPKRAGTFPVKITATNTFGSETKDVVFTIAEGPAVVIIEDTDGDGFADEFEAAFGTSPIDATSTPLNGRPAGFKPVFNITSMTVKLNFTRTGSDSVKIKGTLNVPEKFLIAGQPAVFYVGGILKRLTLDFKGSVKDGQDKFSIKTKETSTTAQVSVGLNRGTLSGFFRDEGLDGSATVKGVSRQLLVVIILNDTVYESKRLLNYTATMNKSGSAKLGN